MSILCTCCLENIITNYSPKKPLIISLQSQNISCSCNMRHIPHLQNTIPIKQKLAFDKCKISDLFPITLNSFVQISEVFLCISWTHVYNLRNISMQAVHKVDRKIPTKRIPLQSTQTMIKSTLPVNIARMKFQTILSFKHIFSKFGLLRDTHTHM